MELFTKNVHEYYIEMSSSIFTQSFKNGSSGNVNISYKKLSFQNNSKQVQIIKMHALGPFYQLTFLSSFPHLIVFPPPHLLTYSLVPTFLSFLLPLLVLPYHPSNVSSFFIFSFFIPSSLSFPLRIFLFGPG